MADDHVSVNLRDLRSHALITRLGRPRSWSVVRRWQKQSAVTIGFPPGAISAEVLTMITNGRVGVELNYRVPEPYARRIPSVPAASVVVLGAYSTKRNAYFGVERVDVISAWERRVFNLRPITRIYALSNDQAGQQGSATSAALTSKYGYRERFERIPRAIPNTDPGRLNFAIRKLAEQQRRIEVIEPHAEPSLRDETRVTLQGFGLLGYAATRWTDASDGSDLVPDPLTAGAYIETLLNGQLFNPGNGSRVIDTLARLSVTGVGAMVARPLRYHRLLPVITDALEQGGIGVRETFDAAMSDWLLSVAGPLDRRSGASVWRGSLGDSGDRAMLNPGDVIALPSAQLVAATTHGARDAEPVAVSVQREMYIEPTA